MDVKELLQIRRDDILFIAAKYGARNVRIFGSVARGDACEKSDVDFLVAMQEGRSLLDLIGLSEELEFLLQREVDVITDRGISPYLRESIYAEAVTL